MRISDWSSDVCSSDLDLLRLRIDRRVGRGPQPGHPGREFRLIEIARRIGVISRKFLVHDLRDLLRRRRTARRGAVVRRRRRRVGSEEHTSELQSLMRISYAVFCLKKKKRKATHT